MTPDWQVWQAGRILGPWTADELAAAAAAGKVSANALIREVDGTDWRPLTQDFPGLLARPKTPRRRASRAEILLTIMATGALATLLAMAVMLLQTEDLTPLTLRYRWFWAAVASGGGASLLAAALLWWRATGRLMARRPEAGGAIRIVLSMVAITGAVLFGVVWQAAPRASDVAAAIADMRDYRFFYSPADKSLRIVGYIGPRFDVQLAAELERNDVQKIEIISGGGLVWEAVHAARAIERRNLTTIARTQCDSACIIVLMGGQRRQIDYDAALGFHAPAPILDGYQLSEVGRQGRLGDEYLVSRGVPREILAEAKRLGPSKIYYLPGVDLVDRGVLTGLLKGDSAIEPRDARFLLGLARSAQAEGDAPAVSPPAAARAPPSSPPR